MITAQEALARLKEGNRHFVADDEKPHILTNCAVRAGLTDGQEPFAVVLSCSDSRLPTNIVFDQGLGDLFVIRVAGNVVASSQIGSVEFAVEEFGTPLVVVLGHSGCGAVAAAIEELRLKKEERSPNLAAIVDRIIPVVKPLMDQGLDHETLASRATRANVLQSVRRLEEGSGILAGHLARESLLIVGAEYDLRSGEVEFYTDETAG